MKKSFTLIELMIVIAILGILAAMISGNFITSLKKGRDARRKTDLEQIQRALEMYYEDNKVYPLPGSAVGQMNLSTAGQQLCHPTLGCSSTTGKIYMQKLPTDPLSGNIYLYQSTDGSSYLLFSCIENLLDQGPGVLQTGYGINCGGCGLCKYKITSSNIQP